MTTAYQLPLDLGPVPSTPATRDASFPTLELDVVICHACTGRHPVERCPVRVVCALCTGRHLAADHPRSGR